MQSSLVAAMLLAATVATSPALAARLVVTVSGVRNADGVVQLCLWNAPAHFPDCTGRPVARRATLPARPGDMVFDLPDLAPGLYAVSVHHDENGNGRVDSNFLGIPREGVGASNDARGRFGPPSFDQAAVRVNGDGAISVRLVYP